MISSFSRKSGKKNSYAARSPEKTTGDSEEPPDIVFINACFDYLIPRAWRRAWINRGMP